jgi:protein TonB
MRRIRAPLTEDGAIFTALESLHPNFRATHFWGAEQNNAKRSRQQIAPQALSERQIIDHIFKEVKMSNKKFLFGLAALLVWSASGLASAGDTPASFDASKCKVPYPKESAMNEEEGMTTMSILVNPDGTVADAKLERSSGFKGLDKAALKGMAACKFKPGTKDGAPIQSWTKVEYSWKLN